MSSREETGIRMLARAAAEFARGELAANRQESDRFPFGPFFSTVLQKAFDLDFFHISLPDSAGGVGMGVDALCVVLEEVCRQDASLGAIVLTHCLAQEILLSAGRTDLIKARADKADEATRFLLACPLFNNPAEIRHVAEVLEEGGRSFLSGTLEYLVLGGLADVAVVPGAKQGQASYSYYLVDLDQSSVAVGEPVLSLGLHCCPAVDTEFQKAEAVPVGGAGQGAALFNQAAARLHPAAAAISLGIMKGAFDEARAYADQREQGGRKIRGWSEMQMMLADMAINIKIADMVVAETIRAVEGQEKGWEQKALAAAIHVQQAAVQVTTDGVQALGGVGYMQDFGQEKRFRDAKHIQACFGLTPMKKLKYLELVSKH
ncbi:MAG: acyl-CoA dehydrogenase family protein [Deltaproteobacteria bacterium]|jgi:alkylation response protein AidB-like acyl-CoA dehydrogenase|nr:acyl-CoA dehydrogenase family protein [Deltaproteobacteria bacterium]MBW2478600.1 acyl-CoA dehydrogenase family protein [Deltaproteobacteria bacterium]